MQLEQGVHKKDNPLLQRFEKKLGIWLTGNSDRIGTPKAEKEKKKAVQKKTPTSSKVKPAKTENADSKVAAVENGPSIDETLTAATETGEQDDHKETEQVKT